MLKRSRSMSEKVDAAVLSPQPIRPNCIHHSEENCSYFLAPDASQNNTSFGAGRQDIPLLSQCSQEEIRPSTLVTRIIDSRSNTMCTVDFPPEFVVRHEGSNSSARSDEIVRPYSYVQGQESQLFHTSPTLLRASTERNASIPIATQPEVSNVNESRVDRNKESESGVKYIHATITATPPPPNQKETDFEISHQFQESPVIPPILPQVTTENAPIHSSNFSQHPQPNKIEKNSTDISNSINPFSDCEQSKMAGTSSCAETKQCVPWGPPDYGIGHMFNVLCKNCGVTSLYDWQDEVLRNEDMFKGRNFLYSLPTSGGKTLVAELAMLRALHRRPRASCLFVVPYVGIAEEKTTSMRETASVFGLNVEGFYGDQGRFLLTEAPSIFVATIEKANVIFNRLYEDKRVDTLACLIVDEMHMVGDDRRGAVLEMLLCKMCLLSPTTQIIGMSATISNLPQLGTWLRAVTWIGDYRPVKLDEYVIVSKRIVRREDLLDHMSPPTEDGGVRMLEELPPEIRTAAGEGGPLPFEFLWRILTNNTADEVAYDDFSRRGIDLILSTLIFSATKAGCCRLAGRIAQYISSYEYRQGLSGTFETGAGILSKGTPSDSSDAEWHLADEDSQSYEAGMSIRRRQALSDKLRWLNAPADLCNCAKIGVAYHNSDLFTEVRQELEQAFKSGVIKIIVCTPTLATGVNLPAARVIILEPRVGRTFLKKALYTQMCGRAGRTGLSSCGESYIYLKRGEYRDFARIMNAPTRRVDSSFFNFLDFFYRFVLEFICFGGLNITLPAAFLAVRRYLMGVHVGQMIGGAVLTRAIREIRNSVLFGKVPLKSTVFGGFSHVAAQQEAHDRVVLTSAESSFDMPLEVPPQQESIKESILDNGDHNGVRELKGTESCVDVEDKINENTDYFLCTTESVEEGCFHAASTLPAAYVDPLDILFIAAIVRLDELKMVCCTETNQEAVEKWYQRFPEKYSEHEIYKVTPEWPIYSLAPTSFGLSVVKGIMSVDQAAIIDAELRRTLSSGFVLFDDLHPCFHLVPLQEIAERPVDWQRLWAQVQSELAKPKLDISHIAFINTIDRIGVQLDFINRLASIRTRNEEELIALLMKGMQGRGGSTQPNASCPDEALTRAVRHELLKCKRLLFAFVLRDIINEEKEADINSRYGVVPGTQENFRMNSSIFGSSVVAFCEAQGWNHLAQVLKDVVKRISSGVREDILPIVEIKGIGAQNARYLRKAGYRTVTDIARANKHVMCSRLVALAPKLHARFFGARRIQRWIDSAIELLEEKHRDAQRELEEIDAAKREQQMLKQNDQFPEQSN